MTGMWQHFTPPAGPSSPPDACSCALAACMESSPKILFFWLLLAGTPPAGMQLSLIQASAGLPASATCLGRMQCRGSSAESTHRGCRLLGIGSCHCSARKPDAEHSRPTCSPAAACKQNWSHCLCVPQAMTSRPRPANCLDPTHALWSPALARAPPWGGRRRRSSKCLPSRPSARPARAACCASSRAARGPSHHCWHPAATAAPPVVAAAARS